MYGLLVQAGASDAVARVAMLVVGAVLLAATWRYRSFALALAAGARALSIVWLDYFTLAALPLALARPRLSWIWFLPLATWGAEGAGIGIGDVRTDLRVLVVFCVVLAVAFRGEPARRAAGAAGDVTTAARKAIEITALGVVPLLALVIGLTTFAGQDRLALDFHHELYPQAQAVVHGRDAYPPPDADLSDGTNAIWPMAAVLPASPLTALPPVPRTGSSRSSCSRRSRRRSGPSMCATGGCYGVACSGRR